MAFGYVGALRRDGEGRTERRGREQEQGSPLPTVRGECLGCQEREPAGFRSLSGIFMFSLENCLFLVNWDNSTGIRDCTGSQCRGAVYVRSVPHAMRC